MYQDTSLVLILRLHTRIVLSVFTAKAPVLYFIDFLFVYLLGMVFSIEKVKKNVTKCNSQNKRVGLTHPEIGRNIS